MVNALLGSLPAASTQQGLPLLLSLDQPTAKATETAATTAEAASAAASASATGAEAAADAAAQVDPTWSESLGSFFHNLLFVDWEWASAFQRSTWEELMYGVWVGLPLLAALLLLLELIAKRAGYPPTKRVVRWVSIAMSVSGLLAYFSFFNPNVRHHDFYHRHEFFHYYLGSKFAEELGYTRLYECTVAAELELGQGAKLRRQEMRDLRSENLIRPITESPVFENPKLCTEHFSEERWAAFKADVEWIESVSSGRYWASMKRDHGYNPPPVWTTLGKVFSELGPASDGMFKALAAIDVVLQASVIGLLAWAFGWRVAALAAVFWGCNGASNFYWTGGAFLRQDWITLLTASLCFAKKKHFTASGAAFIAAGLLRLFPLALGLGWLAMMAMHWLRHRRVHPDHRRFMVGCALSAAILIPTAAVVAGPGSFKEFASHISLHNRTALTNHMGVEPALVHTWDARMRFTRDDSESDPFKEWKQRRADRKQALRPLAIAISLLLAGWVVWALRRTKHFWVALPMSIPFAISLTSITCYYYVMFILLAALVRLRPSLGPPFMVAAAGSQLLYQHYHWIDDRFTGQSYLFVALSLLPLVAFSRPMTRTAIAEWWRSLAGQKESRDSSEQRSQREAASH